MAKTLSELIGFETMTAAIQDPAAGLPTTALPAGFFTNTVPVAGNVSSYEKTTTTRKTSVLTAYEAASRPSPKTDESKVPVTLIHSREHMLHGATLLAQLKSGDTGKQRLASQTIGRQMANFRRRFGNLRTASVYSLLAQGKIYFNSDGTLLPSSSGAEITVDFQVPASSIGNADIGDWDTTSTDIAGQITEVKETHEKLTGLEIRHCLYGKNVLNYLALNDSIKNLVNGNNSFSTAFLQNTIPSGLLEMTWWRSNRMWYEDADGTIQDFFGDNSVVMFPEPGPDWYELQEGSYAVPTELGGVASDAVAALGDVAEVNGMFSYATLKDDPVAVKHIAGDTFLPVSKVPGALRIVNDVTAAAA